MADTALYFSVIITTHNRPRLVVPCVESVLAQTFPTQRYETIVVDDGSRTSTARALAPYHERGQIQYFRQAQQGWGAARLLGVRHSRGEIVAFLDDDCVASPGWLTCYAAHYAAHPDADGIGGGLRPGPSMNVAGCKQYLGHLTYFNRLNAPFGTQVDRAGRAWFTYGGNRTFRREVWMGAQPDRSSWYFDDTLIDLTLREQGAIIYYTPDAWVMHHYLLGVPQRIRAAYRYGRSERRVPETQRTGLLLQHDTANRSLMDRWRQLRQDIPAASWAELVWYALTQPLTSIARWVGQNTVRESG